MRYGILLHDPDGDMGYGVIVGTFKTAAAADDKADAIRKVDTQVEAVVLPIISGTVGARQLTGLVNLK